MSKPAVAVLIVISALAFVALHGEVVLARLDDSVQIFGHNLRLRLEVELSWEAPGRVSSMTSDPCHILPDTLEVP